MNMNQVARMGPLPQFQGYQGMMNLRLTVQHDRLTLIEVIRINRSKHAKTFNANVALYRAKQRDWLETQRLELTKENPVVERQMNFPAPQHFIKNYDTALRMLECCTDETIELDQATFQSLVMDDWEGGGINAYPLAINSPLLEE